MTESSPAGNLEGVAVAGAAAAVVLRAAHPAEPPVLRIAVVAVIGDCLSACFWLLSEDRTTRVK